jgi:lactoylglutathione lyase
MGESLSPTVTGVILFTKRFDACVRFYRDQLGLSEIFAKDGLVCLRFGAGYLMVEEGGHAANGRKSREQNPTVLRFDVDDLDGSAAWLRKRGVEVDVLDFDWGRIGQFTDPDGNLGELLQNELG